jgi:hypothetical protein
VNNSIALRRSRQNSRKLNAESYYSFSERLYDADIQNLDSGERELIHQIAGMIVRTKKFNDCQYTLWLWGGIPA